MKGLEGIVYKFFTLIFLVLLFFGCDEETLQTGNDGTIRPLTPEEEFFVKSSNQFAFSLLHDNKTSGENISISPLSVGAAIGIISNTVSDNDFSDFRKQVGLPDLPRIEFNKAYYEVSNMLPLMDENIHLNFYNSLWTNYSVSDHNDFYTQVLAYYKTDIQEIYPGKSFDQKHINKWSEVNSKSLFKSIQKFNYLSDFQIINLGIFEASFLENRKTQLVQTEFVDLNGNESTVKMNYIPSMKVGFEKVNGVNHLQLPISNESFTLEIIMPEQMDIADPILYNTEHLNLVETGLVLPDIKSTFELKLNEYFDRHMINQHLSKGLTDNLDIQSSSLSDYSYINKTLVQITGQNQQNTPALLLEKIDDTEDLIVINRPFYFFVKEKNSDLILFEGVYASPK